MATSIFQLDPTKTVAGRQKKVAKPNFARVTATTVVDRLYAEFSTDMARLAE